MWPWTFNTQGFAEYIQRWMCIKLDLNFRNANDPGYLFCDSNFLRLGWSQA